MTQVYDPNDLNAAVVSSVTAAPARATNSPQLANIAAPPAPTGNDMYRPDIGTVDLQNTQVTQDIYTPAMNALLQARDQVVQQYTDISNNLRPKPTLLDKIGGFLSHIPIIGDVANTIISGEEFVFNKINKAATGQEVFGVGDDGTQGALQGDSDWRSRQEQSLRQLEATDAAITDKIEKMQAMGPEAFNGAVANDRQASLDHRSQLINSGFYSKEQVANGMGHPLAGGAFSLRMAHRALVRRHRLGIPPNSVHRVPVVYERAGLTY